MQTDRSRQQVPQVPESEEMSSAPSTEPEPSSPQREEDQQEDPPCAIDSNSGTSTTANIQNVSTANLIPITIDNEAINVSDKKSSINREMKRNLSIEETLAIPPILKKRLMDQDNQYAAEMKSGEIQMFDEVQRSDVAPHTESILCENIDETLQRRPTEVKNNDLNTHYSPRLMREGDIDPPDLNPIDQLDVNVSVGHNDCQPLHGPVSDPNLRSLDLLTMQTDRSRQQDPQVPESEEMSSSPSTEPEPSSPQREEDQHQEDRPCAIDSNSGTLTTANISQSPIQPYSIYIESLNVSAEIHIPNDNLINFSTLNRRQISLTLAYNKHYMDNFEQQTNVPDKKLFTKFMTFFSKIQPGFSIDAASDGRPWPSFLKHRLKDHHNQYAYAEVLKKNGERIKTKPVYPVHRNNSASSTKLTKHSEETLIEEIDKLLKEFGIEVRKISIYTYYSPCLKRGNKYCNCMTQLVQKAYQWYSSFGIVTVVYFSEPWGLRGPDILKDFSSSDVLSIMTALYPDVEQEIRFTLDTKQLRQKNRAINPEIKMFRDDKDVQIAFKSAHNGLCKLTEDSKGFLKSQHLDRGLECIDSITFPPDFPDTIIETLRRNWIELVNYCFIKKSTRYFNNAVVKLVVSDLRLFLGNSGFFQIYQVPLGAEVEEGDYVELNNT